MNTDEIKKQLNIIRQSTNVIESLLDNTVINVGVNDNLLSMIDSNPANSIFSIDPAFVLTADFDLKKPVTLLSAKPTSGRVSATSFIGPLFIGAIDVQAPNVNFKNLVFTGRNKDQQILSAGDGFVLDGCIVRGTSKGQHRGVRTDAKNVNIARCYIYNIFDLIDTQAIGGWDGCNGLTVDDCYLEASGENVLFGGADASSEANICQNISFNNCDLFKPMSWKNNPAVTVKNLFELKCAKNVKVTNCRMSNCWTSGQTGYGIVITVRNQDGSAPFAIIDNVLFDNNTINNVGAAVQILGRDYTHPSKVLNNLVFQNNGFTGIDGLNGAGRQFLINAGGNNISIINNKFKGQNINSAFSFDNPAYQASNLVVKDNEFLEGDYGIFGDSAPALGVKALEMYAPGYTWNNNIIHKGTSGRIINYPPGTIIV